MFCVRCSPLVSHHASLPCDILRRLAAKSPYDCWVIVGCTRKRTGQGSHADHGKWEGSYGDHLQQVNFQAQCQFLTFVLHRKIRWVSDKAADGSVNRNEFMSILQGKVCDTFVGTPGCSQPAWCSLRDFASTNNKRTCIWQQDSVLLKGMKGPRGTRFD